MRPLFTFSLMSILLLLSACSHQFPNSTQNPQGPSSHQRHANSYPTGDISITELKNHPKFFKHHQTKLDQKAVQALADIKQPIEIISYFGLWCHDSQREIPQLLDLLAAANNPNIQHHLIALDLKKQEPKNRQQMDRVLYTPTIIVRLNNQELGRIVERPKQDLATDIVSFIEAASL
ncbi:thioredoxin family protein [Kangiella sp. TOML190]|uniref:thioredoxin family protein n=1 Tax=Kangiella sp. TOML190 TaxID=2931351 RepID=UPI00203E2FCC|nr:thioredoxin family protein [Kangiella sp. TOML190]